MTDQTKTITGNAPASFPEAPAVVFTQLYGTKEGQVIQFNLTVRGENGPAALDELIHTIQYAQEKYKLSTTRPDMHTAPAPAPAATAPAPSTAAAAAAAAMPNVPAGNIVNAVKLEVIPTTDGKVTLKWYAAGHQYPDFTSTRLMDRALEILAPTGAWTTESLCRAAAYTVNHRIVWRESEKKNTQGKPYKDLVSLTLAA